MPTAAQAKQAVILAQYLSNGFRPIYLLRYNPTEKYICTIAGESESIEIVIFEDGQWRFIDD